MAIDDRFPLKNQPREIKHLLQQRAYGTSTGVWDIQKLYVALGCLISSQRPILRSFASARGVRSAECESGEAAEGLQSPAAVLLQNWAQSGPGPQREVSKRAREAEKNPGFWAGNELGNPVDIIFGCVYVNQLRYSVELLAICLSLARDPTRWNHGFQT